MSESLLNGNTSNSSPYTDFFSRICPDDNMDDNMNINNTIDIDEIKTESDNIHNTADQNMNRNDLTNDDYTDENTYSTRRLNFYDLTNDENSVRNQHLNSLMLIDLCELQQLVDKDEYCSICLKNYETNLSTSNVCKLGCSHHFHTNCLSQWMASHHTCPLCRTQFCPIFL